MHRVLLNINYLFSGIDRGLSLREKGGCRIENWILSIVQQRLKAECRVCYDKASMSS
jgi:hypothetical protein